MSLKHFIENQFNNNIKLYYDNFNHALVIIKNGKALVNGEPVVVLCNGFKTRCVVTAGVLKGNCIAHSAKVKYYDLFKYGMIEREEYFFLRLDHTILAGRNSDVDYNHRLCNIIKFHSSPIVRLRIQPDYWTLIKKDTHIIFLMWVLARYPEFIRFKIVFNCITTCNIDRNYVYINRDSINF